MSTIRNRILALAASASLAGGLAVAAAPQADAATICSTTPLISCSKYWAERTNPAAIYFATPTYSGYALQKAIWNAGIRVSLTGKHDYQSAEAVRNYQRSRGLSVTGTANSATMYALRSGAGVKASSTAQKAVQYAYAQIGKSYVSGGTGPYSYDCSGLTYASYRYAGKTISRTSYAQLSNYRYVSRSSLMPGDIVGYYSGGHVGIYVGNGYIIHASRPGVPVQKVPLGYMPYYKSVRPVG